MKPLRVLVACEFSGVIRDAFRSRGHDAWSCDLLPGRGKGDFFHVRCDITTRSRKWFESFDLAICHPPCDRLLVAGALHWARWRTSGEQQKAIRFFMFMVGLPIEKIAVENPVGIMSTVYRKPDQIIQPWMFGHMEQKTTCLWLKGLPLLVPTNDVYRQMMRLPKNRRERVHYESPGMKDSLTRSQRRSIMFTGIGDAMAEQWGG
jgi:hypothetical protein